MHAISQKIVDCFKRGNKLMICGNGGSAAMSQEMAAELVCTFEIKNRKALPALALTTDTSILTAWGNDFGFEDVFARQVEALGKAGDILLIFSTSGKSTNVISAASHADYKNLQIIDFPRSGISTASIQEYQHKLMHRVCREVEKEMCK